MSEQKPVTIAAPARPFTDAQQATLNALMDLMIPASPDARMPAASSLGLYDAPLTMRARPRADLARGLDALATLATSRYGRAFAELDGADAMALVDDMRSSDAAFVTAFTVETMARYVQNDGVMAELGLEPRPHWPQGHEVPQGDWSLLEPVRERGAIWREV